MNWKMKSFGIRGTPIGAVSSQTLGNLAISVIDHKMKYNDRKSAYFRYCDDVLGLARTKAEAIRKMMEFQKLSSEVGVVLKASAVVSPIGRNLTDNERKRHKKKRKRQRGGRWKKHRLSGILLYTNQHQDKEIN